MIDVSIFFPGWETLLLVSVLRGFVCVGSSADVKVDTVNERRILQHFHLRLNAGVFKSESSSGSVSHVCT